MEKYDDLPVVIKIKGCNCSSFQNGLHVALQRRLFEKVAEFDLKKLNIKKEVMTEWEELIEKGLGAKSRGGIAFLTKQMKELDVRRTRLISHFFGVVRAQLSSLDREMAEAAERLHIVVRARRGMQKMSREEKSGSITMLLRSADELAADVKRLGLKAAAEELGRMNDEYSELVLQRTMERTAYTAFYKVRPELDRVYSIVSNYITAAYLLSATDDDRVAIMKLVSAMESIIAEYRRIYRESMAQKRRFRRAKEELAVEEASELVQDSDSREVPDSEAAGEADNVHESDEGRGSDSVHEADDVRGSDAAHDSDNIHAPDGVRPKKEPEKEE